MTGKRPEHPGPFPAGPAPQPLRLFHGQAHRPRLRFSMPPLRRLWQVPVPLGCIISRLGRQARCTGCPLPSRALEPPPPGPLPSPTRPRLFPRLPVPCPRPGLYPSRVVSHAAQPWVSFQPDRLTLTCVLFFSMSLVQQGLASRTRTVSSLHYPGFWAAGTSPRPSQPP